LNLLSFELILPFSRQMHLDQKVSLKSLHTFGMEAEARYFVEAKSHSEILTLLNYRHMIRMPILFLGGGSNVLFTSDFAGIVIRISSKGIAVKEETEDQVLVTVEAGEIWDEFVQHAISRGWAGLENLSLIPGSVGAAPIQNIGAYGAEVKDVIDSVRVVEIDTGRQRRYTNEECEFGYRDSIFKRALKGKVIILNVTFRLLKVTPNVHSSTRPPFLRLDYGDIRAELERSGIGDPTIADVREVVCGIRRRKLPDPAVTGNAGSFFKNPVISKENYGSLRVDFPRMPSFPVDKEPGQVKIPAAWLIEQCGWKGYRDGDAGVHPDQPLILVNYGSATGLRVLGLANRIVDSVREKFGISLEM